MGSLGTTSTSVFAASWSYDLNRWSNSEEISTITKDTSTDNYYMEVTSVGGHYDSVEHWIEGRYGGNYSNHYITKEGSNNSPDSTAEKGDSVVLNVKNPISTHVTVSASGAWSPN